MFLRRLLFFGLSGCLIATEPVPMEPYPYPKGAWYLSISGFYDAGGDEPGAIYEEDDIKPGITLRIAECLGPCGDAEAEERFQSDQPRGLFRHQATILLTDGATRRFPMAYLETECLGLFRFDIAARIDKGQVPIGIRLYNEKGLVLGEMTCPDIPASPKIMIEEPAPASMAWTADKIISHGAWFCAEYSLDNGKTWDLLRTGRAGNFEFSESDLAQCPHPLVRFVYNLYFKRFVKFYILGRGFISDPTSLPAAQSSEKKIKR